MLRSSAHRNDDGGRAGAGLHDLKRSYYSRNDKGDHPHLSPLPSRERRNVGSYWGHVVVAPVAGILKESQPRGSPQVMISDIGLPFSGFPFFRYPRPLPEQE